MLVQSRPLSRRRWNCASMSACVTASAGSVRSTTYVESPAHNTPAYRLTQPGAERPSSTPVLTLAEDGELVDQLIRKSAGGYLVIPEITQSAAMPGYVWGADVRRIFQLARENVSFAATLHADGPDDAFAQICEGCGVPDGDASKIAFAV